MISTLTAQPEQVARVERSFDGHVVSLTNYLPPYALPVYVELAQRVRKLTILLSTPMESNRNWKPEWGSLDVRVQRTLTLERPWKHPAGRFEPVSIHVPWNTMSLLRRLQPDVILSAQFGVRSLLSACYSTISRTPLVLHATLSEHQEQGRGLARHVLRRWLVRRASCIAVNGESGARYLRKMGADARRLFHVPYTAVPNMFECIPPARAEAQSHKLLYVGQLIDRKGLAPFIEALARWTRAHGDRTVDFALAGSGPLESALRSIERPDNLRLRLLGERSYAELAECYAGAGILAFPTLSDEWGLVVNEALSAGLPVLGSTYSQAVDELCIEGKTGWRFRPDVPEEMDAAIDRALNTPADAIEGMRRAGHELVEKLTPAYAAERFLTAIKAAADTARRSA
jgi:glycosyltransferase involved in cell wall biosynthesis